MAEQTILVNVLIATLRPIIVMIFDMRRKCVVVMRGWIMLVSMDLGPGNAGRNDQCRKQY